MSKLETAKPPHLGGIATMAASSVVSPSSCVCSSMARCTSCSPHHHFCYSTNLIIHGLHTQLIKADSFSHGSSEANHVLRIIFPVCKEVACPCNGFGVPILSLHMVILVLFQKSTKSCMIRTHEKCE